MTRILVLGATGDQGHPLITRLLDAGLTPVAALRNPDALQGTEFANVETVQADLYDAQSMINAAQDTDAIAANLPFVFDREKAKTLGNNIAAAAKENGVKKIVFNTSCFVADKDNDNPAHDGRRDIEQAIINSGTPYAIFEPKVFMDNMIRGWNKPPIVNQGVFAYPAKPDLLISWICLDDVAAYMVEALTRDDIPSDRYAIGGPEALLGDQVAERLSKVMGKKITFNSLTPDEFASGMSLLVTGSAQVEPLSIYDGMAGFYRFYNVQAASPLIADNDKINRIFSHRPASLEQWAERQDWTDPTDPALRVRMAGVA
ncbi:NAD-dependent epimerase/dehydratase family protein [Halieaceae bacterium IMCC14734]|uniref:NAD-dependent epimerase/dehydratase family protein n=1 Tax=Candidatus Litorirhabdus singularis TaxID=2518993 RepID=A0ABT3TG32_9GAMM|nr:NmrA family NAD(P)-binding protein [Candidatus Litorirhabdus singularis]MCX2980780.1 NAD-dependent epimerase/dehydratase family protein [Candidatus Litorirhabdus singularis]